MAKTPPDHPIVCRLPDGAEYGFASLATAQELYGDEVVAVRYQDGSPIEEEPQAPADGDAPPADTPEKSGRAARGTKP